MDNHIYPSKDAVFKMYKYLTTYENTIATHPGEFELESKELQQFLVKHKINYGKKKTNKDTKAYLKS